MSKAPRLAGTCYFKVDGEQLELKGGMEAPLSKKSRETLNGSSGVAGYKETIVTPYIKATFFVPPGFPREKITESDDMTITAEFANGSVYTLSGAYLVGDATFKGDDGEVDLEFNGTKGNWL